jgi:hypothetical protein
VINSFAGLGEFRFAKFGLEDGVSSVLSLDVGIAIICFAGFVIGMAPMCMRCMYVTFLIMTYVSCVRQYSWIHMYCQFDVMACMPTCDDSNASIS